MNAVTLTGEERFALRVVFAYLESERKHYEENPSADHIWLQVQVAGRAILRLTRAQKERTL